MKIQLPFGRTVDTDVEPPEDTPEMIEAQKKHQEMTSEAGKHGSLTKVLLSYGVLATAKELFSEEKLEAAGKLRDELKDGFCQAPEAGVPSIRLDNLAHFLIEVSRKIREVEATKDTAAQELLTQIILPDLRDQLNETIRYVIDPAAKERDEQQQEEEEKGCACGKCGSEDEDDVEKANPEDDGYTYAPGEVPQFIFDVKKCDDVGWTFTIEPVKHWQAKHCVSDCYSAEEHKVLDPILEQVGLVESMEATYEVADVNDDPIRVTQALEAAGLKQDAEFTEWLERHTEGDEEEEE